MTFTFDGQALSSPPPPPTGVVEQPVGTLPPITQPNAAGQSPGRSPGRKGGRPPPPREFEYDPRDDQLLTMEEQQFRQARQQHPPGPDRHETADDRGVDAATGGAMPQEWHRGVDELLMAPPPSLREAVRGGKGGKGKGKGKSTTDLKRERAQLRRQPSKPTGPSHGNRRPGPSQPRQGAGLGEPFDFSLLQEAMSYCDNLKAQAVFGGGDEAAPPVAPGRQRAKQPPRASADEWTGSPPRQGNPAGALRRRKSNQQSAKPRAHSAEVANPYGSTGGGGTGAAAAHSKRKGGNGKRQSWSSESRRRQKENGGGSRASDLAAMVSNFENGTEVERLRRELAQSQASMEQSKAALRGAATEYYRSHR